MQACQFIYFTQKLQNHWTNAKFKKKKNSTKLKTIKYAFIYNADKFIKNLTRVTKS